MRIIKLALGFIAAVIICYLGFVAFIVFSEDIDNYLNRTDFNSESWKNWEETELTGCLRWDMTHSLTSNYELVGMTANQIIELLGTPSNQSDSNMSYYLGMARHGIDTGSLILELENGVVVDYRVSHG
ncbi:hypothetical protein [Marinoscillum furvescens]|uniref:Uncharacterized protein n=1 Tax=Marinoscillum furvescens DSM 4134 TaxID=1122208 RepID=A0A3D9KYK9_MARFU|nr:hypothetical protein [Marinoscillum furvescens]RED94893.1 hypothetical protein C7460_1194 [Marinoscillum furvescens DSM 4134]